MRLADIAYKNIRGSAYKYAMYFLSNTLAVTVFFIFANFIYNPAVDGVKEVGSPGAITGRGLILCNVVIVVFSFFFISYSVSNFLKSREKEFGLLSLFGMTKAQVRLYVLYENMIISIMSIITGILVGTVFSKLFFMAISVILQLDEAIPFRLSVKAMVITAGGFLLLFQVLNMYCVLRIKNRNIVELLKGSRIPKPVPGFSVIKSILGILLLGVGYGMAVVSYQAIIVTMFPIVFITIIGTYFLLTQFSVLFTRMLQKNRGIFYKGTHMITLSQIIYKLKDNGKVLFLVSILGAVTLTAAGTVYCVQQGMKDAAVLNFPQDVSIIEKGINTNDVIEPGKVEEILQKNGKEVEHKDRIVLLPASGTDNIEIAPSDKNFYYGINTSEFLIMSSTDYNNRAAVLNKDQVNLKDGEALIHTYQFSKSSERIFEDRKDINLSVFNRPYSFSVVKENKGGIINPDNKNSTTVVVSDNDYRKLSAGIDDSEKLVYYGYNIKDWETSFNAVMEISNAVDSQHRDGFNDRVIEYSTISRMTGAMLFIGMFIAILFFMATGSIIYFRLFSEIQRDRAEFAALRKIGMSLGEMKKTIGIQTAVIFFIPFAIAVLHAAFALKALENLLNFDILVYTLMIFVIYFILQLGYYIFARTVYIRQVKSL